MSSWHDPSMANPYENPTKTIALQGPDPLLPFRWKRIVVFSASAYVLVMLIGFASGLSLYFWEIYGSDLTSASDNARLVRRTIVFLVYTAFFWLLAAPVRLRLLTIFCAFVAFEFISVTIDYVVFRSPANELFDLGAILRLLTAAVMGWLLALWTAHRRRPRMENYDSVSPTP